MGKGFDSALGLGEGVEQERKPFTVSELTALIREVLEAPFSSIWVEGEVSNIRRPASGHLYFSLKDAGAQIRCVMFQSYNKKLRFEIEDGMHLLCFGNVSVYEKDGSYQLYVQDAQPRGIGALQMAFLQLKERLEKEGLFSGEKKKMPLLPECVGVVTSRTGAAIRDIINVITRRFPNMRIILYPVKVQGEGAADEIASAIRHLNAFYKDTIDVMIVGRGGGSIEDLWAFNEEAVARAIYASEIPVISAVGHEIDWTIADFVADLRAPTPSAAAELAVPRKDELVARIEGYRTSLFRHVSHMAERLRFKLGHNIYNSLVVEPLHRISQLQQYLDGLMDRLANAVSSNLVKTQLHLQHMGANLEILNPLAVLKKGYAIVKRQPKGSVVKSSDEVSAGDIVHVQVFKGAFNAQVIRQGVSKGSNYGKKNREEERPLF